MIDTFNCRIVEAAMVDTYTIASDMVGAGPWVQEVGAATIVPGRDPERWGAAIDSFLDAGAPAICGGAIAERLEPQRIAVMLLALARELVSRQA